MRWIPLFAILLSLCFPLAQYATLPASPPTTEGPHVPADVMSGLGLKLRRGFCYGAVPEHWYGSELRNRAHVWFCAALARGEALTISPVTPRVPWEEFAEMARRRAALASGGDL